MAKDRIFIPGVPPDANRVLSAELTALRDELAALQRKAGRGGIVTADTSAAIGEFLNVEGKSSELITIVLPESTTSRRNARITLAFRNTNDVRIVAIAGTVNGEEFVINNQIGTFDAVADGLGGWGLQLGLTAAGPSGGALDAEYVLGATHAALPNGRVATDSTEIDAVLATPNVVSWALNAASVAFSKLANLTGLSVLGRAANSSGVMAAITSTAARQTLRNNDAGTALEWGFPVEIRDDTVDQGDAYALNFGTGISATVAAGVATLNGVNPGWDDVLAVDNNSGANSPHIDAGRFLSFGTEGSIPASGDIRASGTFNVLAGGAVTIDSAVGTQLRLRSGFTSAFASRIDLNEGSGSGTILFKTSNAATVLTMTAFGAFSFGGSTGTADVQFLRSAGASAPPVWANVSVGNLSSVAANTILANATAGAAAPTAVAVAADSLLARVGGNLVSHPWATLAGGGLTYAAGVVAVGAGTGLTVNANDVQLATIADDTFMANVSGAAAVATGKTFASLAGLGLVYDATAHELDVDVADTFAWTGTHSWSGAVNWTVNVTGDVNVTGLTVGIDSDTTMLIHADNDMTITSDADVNVGCDALRVFSNAGAGVAGFIIVDAVTASTPALAAGEGMFWAEDPGVPATRPMFTDDANVDCQVAVQNFLDLGAVSGNQGTISISALKCGGTLHLDPTGATQIEGFSGNNTDGFFFFVIASGSNTLHYLNEDTTATATNRLRVSGNAHSTIIRNNMACVTRGNGRWHTLVRHDTADVNPT